MLLQGTAYWAFLNKLSQYDKYEVNIGHLSKEMVDKIKAEGFGDKIKVCDRDGDLNKGTYIKVASKYAIPVYGPDGKELDNDVIGTIGNGSIIQVIATPKDWTYGKKSGRNLYPDKIKVLKLVKYSAGEEFPDTPDSPSKPCDDDDLF